MDNIAQMVAISSVTCSRRADVLEGYRKAERQRKEAEQAAVRIARCWEALAP